MSKQTQSTYGEESSRAWVTLLTRDSYLPGVIILHHSLRKQRSKYPLVVLVTPSLSKSAKRALELESRRISSGRFRDHRQDKNCKTTASNRESDLAPESELIIRPVDPLLLPNNQKTTLIASRFEDTWTKLRAFELTDYDTCVFLDADIAIYKNVDSLFDLSLPDRSWIAACQACVCNLDHDKWAPKNWTRDNCAYTPLSHPSALTTATPTPKEGGPPQPHALLNGGVFLYRPSVNLWNDMLQFFNTSPILKEFQFPDQDFLAHYFCHKWQPLSWRYNAIKTMENWHRNIWRDEEVCILHYIVDKPWEKRIASDGIAGHLGRDGKTHKWWWQLWDEWRQDVLQKPLRNEIIANGKSTNGSNDLSEFSSDELLETLDQLVARPLDAISDKAQCQEHDEKGFPIPIPIP